MKISIWDGREFDFDDIENEEDLKTMSEDDLRDLRKKVVCTREEYADMDDWGLVLDEVEMLINNELCDRKEHPHLTNDFLETIIDNIEDWLDEKGVRIPNEERDRECGISEISQEEAHIYGADFDWMMEMLRDVCAKNGIIVDDEWH